jgi:hypothetical protein
MSLYIAPESLNWLALAALVAFGLARIDWAKAFPRREQPREDHEGR